MIWKESGVMAKLLRLRNFNKMNYQETMEYLDSLNKLGSVPGLDSIRELLCRLGNPQDSVKFVHIAGTNGKGSVSAFISSILIEEGYRIGRYNSPAVLSPLEIIKLNNTEISKEDFAKIISDIRIKCEKMTADGFSHPTRFEIETSAAFVFFAEKKCDYAVVECGMGGRLDATNVISTTICSVITPISIDHTAFLGNTLSEIAAHKSGIIKKGIPVVSGIQHAKAAEVILRFAQNNKSECVFTEKNLSDTKYYRNKIRFSYKQFTNLEISLLGTYQPYNAATALECILMLRKNGVPISDRSVYDGLCNASWFGRFTRLGTMPDFIVDGAHNPDGAYVLSECLKEYYPEGGLTFIIGVFADKDYAKILEPCISYAAKVITIETPDNSRALSSKALAEFVKNHYDVCVHTYNNIDDGVQFALKNTQPDKGVIAFGSLSHLAAVKQAYMKLI